MVAGPARRETEVVGITGLTTDDPYGTPAHGRHANRRACQANPMHAVGVRTWKGKDSGPGGTTVLVTNVLGDQPLRPFDDDDDRRLSETCGLKEAKPQGDLGHPPQNTERAVRAPVILTRLRFALTTAYRLQCAREATGWSWA